MPRKATRITKGTQIRDALGELLTSLQQHGDVTITAKIGGATFSIRMDDAPVRGRAARAVASEAGLPSATQLLELLHDNPLGMRLKELAGQFGVKPRNRLKPLIARLIEERRVRPAGRRFRAADVVVRRGRKPGSGAGKAGRPGRRRKR
jgi:hypothetical protein